MFCSAVLTFEVFVVVLAALVAFGFRDPAQSVAPLWAVSGAVALLCLLGAGMVRTRAGLWLGSAVQLVLIVSGVVVAMMFAVGVLFAALWVVAIVLGNRIDRERAERAERAAREDRLMP